MSITVGNIKEAHPAIYKRLLELTNIKYENIDDTYWILSLFPNTQAGSTEGEQFWREIDNGNFQVFYDRYPEYAKVQKDWSKATDDELIAEAKRRYPYQTVFNCLAFDGDYAPVISSGEFSRGKFDENNLFNRPSKDTYNGIVFEDGKWAEILCHPEEKPDVKVTLNGTEIVVREPKAGDMVEVFLPRGEWVDGFYFTGGKTKDNNYIVQDWAGDLFEYYLIRLPQKSEVSKMVDSFLSEIYIDDAELNDLVRNAVENAIKWGQQNPDKI